MEQSAVGEKRARVDPLLNPALVAVLAKIAAAAPPQVHVPPPPPPPSLAYAPAVSLPVLYASSAVAPKESKELFVGNIVATTGVNEMVMKDFLNAAMRQVGLVTGPDDAISGIRMNNKFCFLEFRNPEDCSKALNLNGIPFMGSMLKICRPAKYSGPAFATKTWQEMTGQSVPAEVAASASVSQLDPQTKGYREIFVGNLTPDATEDTVRDLVGGALQRMGLCSFEGGESPIASVRLNQKFCFLEFKVMEDAANALNLSGIPCNGIPLKLSRPAKFEVPPNISFYSWEDTLARWHTGELKLLTAGTVSTVLCISNMVTTEDLTDETLFTEMIEDTKDECAQFGSVRSVAVPRPNADGSPARGLGRVFVEMSSEEEAKAVLLALKGRTFDNRTVGVKFYPYQAFASNDFGLTLPPVVITTSGLVPLLAVLSRQP